MRYELSDEEWTAIRPMPPNKPRGVPRVNDRRVLNGAAVDQRIVSRKQRARRACRHGRVLVRPSITVL